jgi:sigma54-dependent transcription regulator
MGHNGVMSSSVHFDTEARRRLLAAATIDSAAMARRWEPLSDKTTKALEEWEQSGGLSEALNKLSESDPDLRD